MGIMVFDHDNTMLWFLVIGMPPSHVFGYNRCLCCPQISKHGIFVVFSHQTFKITFKWAQCMPCMALWLLPMAMWYFATITRSLVTLSWHSTKCVPVFWKWPRTIEMLVVCKWTLHRQMQRTILRMWSHNFWPCCFIGWPWPCDFLVAWSLSSTKLYSIRVDQNVLPWHWVFYFLFFPSFIW